MEHYASLEYRSDEYSDAEEMGLGDLSEMIFEDDGSLNISREMRFLDATEWIDKLNPSIGLGEYWTFDFIRAHSYSAAFGHNDVVKIYAAIPPAFLGKSMVEYTLHAREAEIHVSEHTNIVIKGIEHRGQMVREDLTGKVFHA